MHDQKEQQPQQQPQQPHIPQHHTLFPSRSPNSHIEEEKDNNDIDAYAITKQHIDISITQPLKRELKNRS